MTKHIIKSKQNPEFLRNNASIYLVDLLKSILFTGKFPKRPFSFIIMIILRYF
jgi:hypothetical protein